MVVDDSPDLVEIVLITLEAKGYNVTCANSGKELFAGLEKQKPDLILLDIMMPQMGGLKELTRFKEDPSPKTSVDFPATVTRRENRRGVRSNVYHFDQNHIHPRLKRVSS